MGRRLRRPVKVSRDVVRRVAAGAIALLVLAFVLFTYLDSREAKRALRDSGRELTRTRVALEGAATANQTLSDEVRKLQGLIEATGGTAPSFTFPPIPGPSGPQGPQGPTGPSGTTGTTRPSSTPSTGPTSSTSTTTGPPSTSTTSTTSRPPLITLPTIRIG